MGTLEACIRAVETYGTAEAAMNHMIEMEERGLFHDEIPLKGLMKEPAVCIQPTILRSVEHAIALNLPCNTCFMLYRSGRINITVKIEDQYLMLNELGRVLHELSCDFPGRHILSSNVPVFTSCAMFYFVSCCREEVRKCFETWPAPLDSSPSR